MNLLQFNFPEWFFVALNLVILVLILRRILWKPVGKILEERQAMAAKTQQDALEAQELRAEIERLRAQTEADAEALTAQLMTEARSRAGREYDRIIAEAESRAEMLLVTAKAKAAQEQEKIIIEAKKQITTAALEAAGMLLRVNIDSERNNRLVEAYLSEGNESA